MFAVRLLLREEVNTKFPKKLSNVTLLVYHINIVFDAWITNRTFSKTMTVWSERIFAVRLLLSEEVNRFQEKLSNVTLLVRHIIIVLKPQVGGSFNEERKSHNQKDSSIVR
ncbi:hypothetical protein CEXT_51391 [Caerostris extrusa]|uniref:Uncharacterized protein n=1 Tax=Caerostris extrusa TaxID=172846 RepID=A0AAV4SD63_CAEEX|nr:hypothetical protein CEXT_51391 [Caerostris extrusa]